VKRLAFVLRSHREYDDKIDRTMIKLVDRKDKRWARSALFATEDRIKVD